jgi:hypothetical protein
MSGARAEMGPRDLQRGRVAYGPHGDDKVQTQKKSVFSQLLCLISQVLKPIFHIRTLRPFFYDLLTLSNVKLKFIID